MNCPKCGGAIAAWATMCKHCGAEVPPMVPPGPTRPYRDGKHLTYWVQGVLFADIIFVVAHFVLTVNVLDPWHALTNLALTWVTIITVAMWIYRMHANLGALGAIGMRFTPGWCIGWYSIPIANLWMPYRAMSEIVRASRSPSMWRTDRAGRLVGIWWFLCVLANFFPALYKLALLVRIESAGTHLLGWSQLQDAANVAALLATLPLVRLVHGYQARASTRALAEVFA